MLASKQFAYAIRIEYTMRKKKPKGKGGKRVAMRCNYTPTKEQEKAINKILAKEQKRMADDLAAQYRKLLSDDIKEQRMKIAQNAVTITLWTMYS